LHAYTITEQTKTASQKPKDIPHPPLLIISLEIGGADLIWNMDRQMDRQID